jgi:hypothetical protein
MTEYFCITPYILHLVYAFALVEPLHSPFVHPASILYSLCTLSIALFDPYSVLRLTQSFTKIHAVQNILDLE